MVNKPSRKTKYALLLALTIVVLAVAATNKPVSADPCSAYLSQPTISGASYNSATNLIVPVTATCPSVSGPLYIVGDAYDTTTNTDLGSANAALIPANGPSTFNGQLAFTLPSIAQGDVVQITASIYSGVYGYAQTGPALTTTTTQIDPNSPVNTQDPNGSPSQYCGSGLNCNPQNGWNGNSYSQGSQGAYSNYHHHHRTNNSQYQQQQIVTITQSVPVYIPPDNTWLIDLVIVSVISIAVVGTIAFAILASRNRPPHKRPY